MAGSSVTGAGSGAATVGNPRIIGKVLSGNLAVNAVNSSNMDRKPLVIESSTYTLDHADANKMIVIKRAAGSVITLPAAIGEGDAFTFVVATTVTSNNITIKVANATDVMVGNAIMCKDGGSSVDGWESSGTAGADSFVLNGTTTGGYAGDMMVVTDILSGKFHALFIGAGTSTEATPFASTVS